jgi:hypothetical protein
MSFNNNEEKQENQPIGYKDKNLLRSDTLYKVYTSTIIFFYLVNLVHIHPIIYLVEDFIFCFFWLGSY